MKKYIALIRVGIQRELVYRTNFCIGIFSTVLLFIVEVAIWSAVYQGKEEVGSISYNSIMIYTVMTLLLQRLLGGGTDEEIGNDFQSGNIVTSLLTPLNLGVKYSMQELGKGLLNAFVLLLVFYSVLYKKQRNSVCDTCTKMAALCAGGCFFLYSVQYFKLYAGNFDILESLKHRALYAENGLCQYFQWNVHSAHILPIDSKGILYGTSVSVYLLFSVDHCNGRSKQGTDCRRNPASVGLDRGIVSAVQADEQECNETDRDSGRVRKSCHIHVK